MIWEKYDFFYALFTGPSGSRVLAAQLRAYPNKSRWTAYIYATTSLIQLDPTLTLEEAKLVVQTIVGGQL